MNNNGIKYPSIGKSFKIDQRATKIFLDWLPDDWLAREQKPDFFVDYLVELAENGEPTGLQFGAQIKGFEGKDKNSERLSYAFETKHLKYYRDLSQHPIFLFLINVTSGEGYWLFAQRHLKEKTPSKVLTKQKTLTVHFSSEDDLLNETKFKCLLPEAEKFVRDLHPGSPRAALQKRQKELEATDPRCAVSVAMHDGIEYITINPKESFSFTTKIKSKNVNGWRDFIERGSEVKFSPDEIEILGAPLLAALFKKGGGISTLQFSVEHPATMQMHCGSGEDMATVPIDGKARGGTKFVTFQGGFPESPLEVVVEIPIDDALRGETSAKVALSLNKWVGQPLLLLSYFDQILPLVRALAAPNIHKMQIFVRGNVLWKGTCQDFEIAKMKRLLPPIELLLKGRWLARHFKANPILPNLKSVSNEQWDTIELLYGLIRYKKFSDFFPPQVFSFEVSNAIPIDTGIGGGCLRLVQDKEQTIDLFGAEIRVGPTEHIFTNVKLISRHPMDGSRTKFVFETTEKTFRIARLI